jgi:hypothetical protein
MHRLAACQSVEPDGLARRGATATPSIGAAESDANTRFEAGDRVVLPGESTSLAAAEGRLLKG